jgi:hypothetical protein
MIVAPNVSNVIGAFTMGFGIMASVLTNNVSALAALANGLLPLRKVSRKPAHWTPRAHVMDTVQQTDEPSSRSQTAAGMIELQNQQRREVEALV